MRPKTFLQIMDLTTLRSVCVEQIALRKITVRFGGLRWTYRLMVDGLWHVKP
jgi:hypothetical protein